MELEKFEQNIGYVFKDKKLLRTALTHVSFAYENKNTSNERIEFLGDAVLELVISKYLYKSMPNLSEGEMTKARASVVCEKSLVTIATKHNFGNFLFLGRSEIVNKGNQSHAVLADSVEAVIGAMYLDSNFEIVEKFILSELQDNIKKSVLGIGIKDYKTMLQEKLQVNGDVNIEYTTISEEGPAHNKLFTVLLKCNSKELAKGSGKSKKEAEMEAAKLALNK